MGVGNFYSYLIIRVSNFKLLLTLDYAPNPIHVSVYIYIDIMYK